MRMLFLSLALAQAVAAGITSPTGGESWAAGSAHYVVWTGSSAAEVSFTTDWRTWTHITNATAGRILWTVPNSVTRTAKIRVTAGGASMVSGVFSIVPSQEARYRWTNLTMNARFAPRDGAGALSFNGRMWIIGGWSPRDKKFFPRICNNEVWSSADGRDWTLVKPNTFLDQTFDASKDLEGRHTAGYVVYRGRMWIIGGDVNQRHYQNDVWNSADGRTWNDVNRGKDVPWAPRALHHTLIFQDRIWVMGGQTMPAFGKAEEVFYRDLWTTTDGVRWQQVKPREPYWSPRGMIGGSAVHKGRIWILGGGTYDTPRTPERKFFNDVWSSDDGVNWTLHVENAPWHPRQYHDVAVFDGRLWVMEGYHKQGGNRNDVWYSADGVNWYEVPGTPWKPRHAASLFQHGDALWMVAGNNMESDVWKLEKANH